MCIGGGTPGNTTTTAVPWGPLQGPLQEAIAQLGTLQAPEYFPGATVAPQSAGTQAGIQSLYGAAGGQETAGTNALNAHSFALNDMLNPETNKYLQGTAEAAIKPIYDMLNKNTISGIDDAAIQAGQFGGSSQRNLKRTAINDANVSAFDATGKIYSDAYQNSLSEYMRAMLGTGMVQDAQATPAATRLAAGGIEDAYTQRGIDADVARHNFDQTAEFDYLTKYIATLLGTPMGTSTTTSGGSTSPLQGAIGGAGLGYGLSAMAPALGITGPYGAAGGALLGYLLNN